MPALHLELMHARVRSLRHRMLLSLDAEAGLRVTAGSVIMEEKQDEVGAVAGRLELVSLGEWSKEFATGFPADE